MHDPMVVALEIRRPWPRRDKWHDAKPGGPRWQVRYSWAKWYDLRPKVFMNFWTLAGLGFYWPGLITVWHVEPDGRDSGEVCKHYVKRQGEDGKWKMTFLNGWRWHVHHWRIQVHPFQKWRRRLLTRCEECGRKGSPNHSLTWDGERGPWWKGERGLYHRECASLRHMRSSQKMDEELIRAIIKQMAWGIGRTEEQVVAYLTDSRNPDLEFALRRRLEKILGYKRDDNYKLTKES